MTQYSLPYRRREQPPVPTFDLAEPTPAKTRAARAYIKRVESNPKLLTLDVETIASCRPGLEPDEALTDLQYAHRYLAYWSDYLHDDDFDEGRFKVRVQRRHVASDGTDSPKPQRRKRHFADAHEVLPWAPPRFGKLVMHDGFAVMSSQVLRSQVFQSPPLDTELRALGDRSIFRLKVTGFSPNSDHYQLLLFAISRMSGNPDPQLGAVVRFTTNELIAELGWARNTKSYVRLARLIEELKKVRLKFEVKAEKGKVVTDGPLFSCVTEKREEEETRDWEVVLTPSLLQLFGFQRNTLLEMRACRALHTSSSALWLYSFVASQKPGESMTFDVRQLCRASGLWAARDVDNRKALVKLLKSLQDGSALRRNGAGDARASTFEPIVAAWELQNTSHGWKVSITRSSAFTKALEPA